MKELSITVTVADRQYRLTVDRAEEETIRKVVKLVDKTLKEYAVNYAYKDNQDLLAMAALQFATSVLNNEEQLTFYEQQLETKLTEIDELLSEESLV